MNKNKFEDILSSILAEVIIFLAKSISLMIVWNVIIVDMFHTSDMNFMQSAALFFTYRYILNFK